MPDFRFIIGLLAISGLCAQEIPPSASADAVPETAESEAAPGEPAFDSAMLQRGAIYSFTNAEGQRFNGVVKSVSFRDGTAKILNRANNRVYSLPVDLLSEDSRDYLIDWEMARMAESYLTIDARLKEVNGRQFYEVTVFNGAPFPMQNIDVIYAQLVVTQIKHDFESSMSEYEFIDQREKDTTSQRHIHSIELIGSRERVIFDTVPPALQNTSFEKEWDEYVTRKEGDEDGNIREHRIVVKHELVTTVSQEIDGILLDVGYKGYIADHHAVPTELSQRHPDLPAAASDKPAFEPGSNLAELKNSAKIEEITKFSSG